MVFDLLSPPDTSSLWFIKPSTICHRDGCSNCRPGFAHFYLSTYLPVGDSSSQSPSSSPVHIICTGIPRSYLRWWPGWQRKVPSSETNRHSDEMGDKPVKLAVGETDGINRSHWKQTTEVTENKLDTQDTPGDNIVEAAPDLIRIRSTLRSVRDVQTVPG